MRQPRTVLLDALAEEFLERMRSGEQPQMSEYVERHPSLAVEIEEFFPLLEKMEDLGKTEEVGARPPAGAELPGQVGDYEIIREIGRGGMGVVYEAEQASLGRRVALKVLPYSSCPFAVRQRFEVEAKSAARLHHTNIVPVFEVGSTDGFDYYAMQFIRGYPLDEIIDRVRDIRKVQRGDSPSSSANPRATRAALSLSNGRWADSEGGSADQTSSTTPAFPLSASSSGVTSEVRQYYRTIARMGRDIAQGLHYAHSHGVLHRDVKPSNLLIDGDGEVWIADFGLAQTDDVELTQTGELVGTLQYMAPERFAGHCDSTVDVYALGATLYELATLRPAFAGSDRLLLIESIRQTQLTRPRVIDRRIPPDLETIILKAMAPDPKHRYSTAQMLAEDLERFCENRPIRARRVSVVERMTRWSRRNPGLSSSLAVAFLLAVGLSVVLAVSRDRERAQRVQAEQDLYRAEMTLGGLASSSVLGLNEVDRLVSGWSPSDDDVRLGWEWHHLAELSRPHLFSTMAGEGTVGGRIAWSPDGERLVTSDPEGQLYVLNGTTGEILQVQGGGGGRVSCLEYSPDGKMLAVVHLDGKATFYEAATWNVLFRHPFIADVNRDQLSELKWHPESNAVVVTFSGRRPSEVFEIGPTGLTLTWTLAGLCSFGKFSHDGRYLLTRGSVTPVKGRKGLSLTIWDSESRSVVREFHSERNYGLVYDLGWSPDSESVTWVTLGLGPHIWRDWQNSDSVDDGIFDPAHVGRIVTAESLSWAPDGSLFATGGRDRVLRIWDPDTMKEVRRFSGGARGISNVVWHPEKARVAGLSRTLEVRVWDLEKPMRLWEARPRSTTGSDRLTWGQDQKSVLLHPSRPALIEYPGITKAIVPKHIEMWNGADLYWDKRKDWRLRSFDDGRVQQTLPMNGVHSLRPFRAGSDIVFAGRRELYRIPADLTSPPILVASDVPLHQSAALLTDQRTLVLGSYRQLYWYDINTGQQIHKCKSESRVQRIAPDPLGRWIVTRQEQDTRLTLRDANSGAVLARLTGHSIEPNSMAFHPDGHRLASGGPDQTVRIWDPETATLVAVFQETAPIIHVAWSPDGQSLAFILSDGRIRVRSAQGYADRGGHER